MQEPTGPDESTRGAERAEEGRTHTADRAATSAEESDAEKQFVDLGDEERRRVAEHAEEMNKIGANAKGEGRID